MKKTKKTLSVLLSILMVVSMLPLALVPALAADETPASDVVYSYDAATDTLTVSGRGMIPAGPKSIEELEGENEIAAYVSEYPHPEYMNAAHVVIGEGITGVGEMTFAFYKMETLSLPSTLETIGDAAFAYCLWLESVSFPARLRTIGDYAFVACPQMHTVNLPEGLVSIGTYAFGEIMLNEMHIPASLQLPADMSDLSIYFNAQYLVDFYNASETAVLSDGVYNFGSADAARDAAARFAFLISGEFLILTTGFGDNDEPNAEQLEEMLELMRGFAARVNAKLGTSFTIESMDDVMEMMDALYPSEPYYSGAPAYFTVYCTETGAQHAACAETGYRHKVAGSNEDCMNEITFSGEADGVTWVVDPQAGTLTIGGSGSLNYPDGAPWKTAASYFDTVLFTEDCGITALEFNYDNNPFKGCLLRQITLPAALRTVSEYALDYLSTVGTLVTPQNSVSFYVENGLLYQYLTSEKRTELRNKNADPGAADLMLVRAPRNAQQIDISSRTAVILGNAICNNNLITSVSVPDSVVSIEENAIRSCNRLANVSLGSGVKQLAANSIVFNSYPGNGVITVSEQNPCFTADTDCVYSKDGSRLVMLVNQQSIETLTLGENVTSHTNDVFSYAYALRSLTILNPQFDLNSSGLRHDTVVYGYDDTPAQRYCSTFGIEYVILEQQQITGVALLSSPLITDYKVGDTLCTDGLQLTVTFEDGTSAVRTTGFEIGDYDFSAPGEKSISVSYGGFSDSFTVTVSENAPVYEIRVGESIDLLLKPMDYNYDYDAYVKFVCEEGGNPIPRLSNMPANASRYIQLYDENMEQITGSDISDGSWTFEAGTTYYLHCVIYVPRTDNCHAATLTLYAEHDHNADTYNVIENEPTCANQGYQATYCSVCGLYITGQTLPKLSHEIGEDGRCVSCGKLLRFTIGDGEAKSFVLKEYDSGEKVIGAYTAETAQTVTVTVMQNSNYGAPSVECNGNRLYGNYEEEMRTTTFVADVPAGGTLEICICPVWSEETVVVAVNHTHSFALQSRVEPTCSASGTEHYVCGDCGAVFDKVLYETPHTPDGEYEVVMTQPVCAEHRDGSRYLRCAVCGQTYYDTVYWQHTDENRDGVCDVCGESVGTWITLNETQSFTSSGQGYKSFPFVAPADGEYVFTARGAGGYYASASSKNMGNYWFGGDWDGQSLHVNLKQGEIRVFSPYCYDLIDYTVTVTDVHSPEAHEAVPADCTTDGRAAYWSCAICGKTFSDEACENEIDLADTVIPAGHTLEYVPEVEAFCDAPGMQDYYHCTVCGKNFWADDPGREVSDLSSLTVYTMHHMSQKAGTPATCTEPGVRDYWLCASCGKKYADRAGTELLTDADLVIPAGHTLEAHAAKAATCKEAGNVAYWYCTVCEKYFSDENAANEIAESEIAIPKLTTHTWDNGTVTKPATCKEEGVKTFTCTVCGATKTEPIAKLATHTWDNGTVTKPATCKEEGVKTFTCTVCGETKTEPIAKLTAHTWNAGTVTLQPTCTADGVKTFTCTVCGATKTEPVGKVPHRDNNNDGLCDFGCGTVMGNPNPEQPGQPEQPSGGDKCKYCGETHDGFFGKIVQFFHNILYFFKNLFSR